MPRRTRIHIDGLPLHIVQRGHNRAACFFDDQDRLAYLGWLHEALVRERCRLHAYVLMTNHLHLLLKRKGARLSFCHACAPCPAAHASISTV
jgi:putative transposase